QFAGLKGAHVLVRVDVAALEKAAAENKRTSQSSAVQVDITSKIVYTINAPESANEVETAWWSASELSGGITVNGHEYEIAPGMAQDFYDAPEDNSEWN